MGNSKVIFGDETLIDLTGDTVTSDTLLAGTTAHNRSGEQIVGTVTVPEELDDLTDVTITSPAEGDLLQYDATEQKWVNSAKIQQKVAGLQKTGCINRLQNTADSTVYGGITYTVNANKTITIGGGISTAQGGLTLNEWVSDGSMQGLKLVGCPAGGSNSKYHLGFYNATKGTETSDFGDGTIINNDFAGDTVRVYIRVRNGVDLSTPVTFNPMLTPDLSATYNDYQPYSMTNRELTEAVTNLDERGLLYKADASTFVGLTGDSITTHLPTILDNINISQYSNGQFVTLTNGGNAYTGVFFKYTDNYWTFLACGYATGGRIMTFTKSNNTKAVNIIGSRIQTSKANL